MDQKPPARPDRTWKFKARCFVEMSGSLTVTLSPQAIRPIRILERRRNSSVRPSDGPFSITNLKELVVVFHKAKNAAAAAMDVGGVGSYQEEECVDALKLLKRFPITKDVLLSTKIGRDLRPMTKHPRKRIQAVASDVLETWKGIFKKESRGNGNGDHSTVSKSIKKEKSTSDSKQQGIILLKAAPVSSRSSPLKESNDKNRDTIREHLAEGLGKVAWEVDDQSLREEVNKCDPRHVAAMVEDELFKNWGLFDVGNRTIKSRYRSFLFNIKDPKNPDFRRRILLGHLPPESIVLLSTEGMASDARRLENEKIREKAMFDCELVETEEASSKGLFKCAKCSQDQTTYYQMQTRRADEPMTAFVTCLNCGHRWRA